MSTIPFPRLATLSMMLAMFLAVAGSAGARADAAGAGFREGRFLLAPQAFLTFCRVHPGECPQAAGGETSLALDPALAALLREVNARVNRSVAPVALAGPDVWALDRRSGHCATYAVQKRHELLRAGLPAGAVSLAVVTTPWGELHLVVAVRTDRGTLVLDNLRAEIRPWLATGYRFEKVQSAANPSFWVSVSGPARPETDRVFAWTGAPVRPRAVAHASGQAEADLSATSPSVVRIIPTSDDALGLARLAGTEDGTS